MKESHKKLGKAGNVADIDAMRKKKQEKFTE
jgi:hypothetical protein